MIGLTYRLRRDSDDGPVEKSMVLATRRSGPAGDSFKQQMRDYKTEVFRKDRAAQRWQGLAARLNALGKSDARVAELQAQADQAYDEMRLADEGMYAAAEHLVRLSLAENYGREGADALLDFFTEGDLRACVSLIQCGELPSDFTPYPAEAPKPNSMSPAGSAPARRSSNMDSAAPTSTPDV